MRGARDREPVETPLWARAEAEAASFAPRQIGPRRHAPLKYLAISIGSLAAVVALASAGGNALDPTGAAEAVSPVTAISATTAPSALVAVRPPAIGRVEAGLGGTPVALTLPAGLDPLITGASVTVDGELEVHATTLRIALEVNRLHRLGSITLDATDPNGALRPDYPLRFHAELVLPSPRPTGRVWLVITAYDGAGDAIGTVRQAVEIAPRLFLD